jgi:peptide/nickel transport system permease protein/peptide/nickel transport system substrate-binding protein
MVSNSRWLAAGMTRRQVMSMLAAGAAVATLPALGFAQDKHGGVLRVSASNNPSSLDPFTGRSGFDHPLLYPIFDTLFEFDYDTLQPLPGIVKSWEQASPTKLVLTLNENVLFHDGTPCDAAAVKFNLERGLTDERSNVKTDIANIASIEATAPLQVTINQKNPDSALIMVLSDRPGMMVSPKSIQELGAGTDRNPVGTGAWTFVSWTDNAKVVVKRNEKYWRSDRAFVDGIEYAIIPERNTGLRSVVAGENDLVYSLSKQQEPIIKRAENLEMVSGPTQIINMFYFNLAKGPIADLKVRQALNYAVDREAFNQITQDGEAARTVLPSNHWAYNPEIAKTYPYDPDKAKALLAEAGLAGGFDLACGGWNDQKAVQRQEILIEQFGKVGVRAKFTTASVADSTSQFMADKRGDVYLGAFTGRPDPSQVFQRLFDPKSFLNPGQVDPAAERAELQLQTQAASDLQARKDAFHKLQMVVSENALCLPVTVQYDVTAYAKKVKDFRPNLTGKPKFETVYIAA